MATQSGSKTKVKKSVSPNANIWKDYGLSKEGMLLADKLMSVILPECKTTEQGTTVMWAVEQEVLFQLEELPTRTDSFQKKHAWKPPTM